MGLVGYYRKFIRNYALLSQPLNELLKKNNSFEWTDSVMVAFNSLKRVLTSSFMLALPNFNQEFIVEIEATNGRIGVVLLQQGHPIALSIKHYQRSIKDYQSMIKSHLQCCLQ